MLYTQNAESSLSEALFRDPPANYRGTPFWSFNGKLKKEELLRQIEELKKMGFGGFHMHSRTGLEIPYLGEEFMAMIAACCDKAEAEGLYAWLYDEDRWPSGSAGGQVTVDPRFRRRYLALYPEKQPWDTPQETAKETGESYLLACYDITLDADGFLTACHRVDPDQPAGDGRWYAYSCVAAPQTWFNNQAPVDILDKEAIAAFIRITHERYRETVGAAFGKTVPAIFTDEPQITVMRSLALSSPQQRREFQYGWSRHFAEAYQAAYGEDLLTRLPELFWLTRDRSDAVIKHRYFNLCAHLFAENFSGQIGRWCEQNGIAFTGHMNEETLLLSQAATCGEAMRQYPHFTIPGIDMLTNNTEFTTAKQAQSAVHQCGKEGMLSELYGVTNWDFDFRGHKFQGDWQAALGVTVRVPHLSWVSMAGEAKRDYPASIGYQSPWYTEYPLIENHFARVNTALTRGKAIVRIGVIHPIESAWISAGPRSQSGEVVAQLESRFEKITDWLLSEHFDFDFICESQLPYETDVSRPGSVGKMCYDAVIVPGCLTLRKTTLQFLTALHRAGGSVFFLGNCPAFVDGVPDSRVQTLYQAAQQLDFDKAALHRALEPLREIGICTPGGAEHGAYLYQYRQDTDARWLFIARKNAALPRGVDDVAPQALSIGIKGAFAPVLYDTMTGDIRPLPYMVRNGFTVISHTVCGYDSLLLKLLPPENAPAIPAPAPARTVVSRLSFRRPVSFSLSEPNVLLLDTAEYALDGEALHPEEEILRIDNALRGRLQYPLRHGELAQPYTLPPEPETHTVHLRFTFASDIPCKDVLLALEDAEKTVITLNGAAVPSHVTGYFTDKDIQTVPLPPLSAGENVLTLDIPFGKRTNLEWCYLLGNFGVRVAGCSKTVTAPPTTLGFGDIVPQGLPFYGANLSYHLPVELPKDGRLEVHAPHYRGALVGVSLDGVRVGSIALPPYTCTIEHVAAGQHTLTLTLFGNRFNSFGQLHLVVEDTGHSWYGPNSWRSIGDGWCNEYRTRPTGILSSPTVTILE